MIPTHSYHLAAPAEIHDRLENAPAIGATADVVAEEDQRVLWARRHQRQEAGESTGVAVDVADGECTKTRHCGTKPQNSRNVACQLNHKVVIIHKLSAC